MRDVLFALRGFKRSPGVVLTVVVTIGLALGLNTAMFSLFNAYVLRPFDVRDPYSIYMLAWITRSGRRNLDYQEFEQVRARSSVIDTAFLTENLAVTVEGQPMLAQRVSANYFETLGVGASMGRVIGDGDAQQMVLSYGAWKSKFASDPHILGRSFAVAGTMYTVTGVARQGFEGLAPTAMDFWIPLSSDHPPQLNSALMVRIKHSISIRQAQAELGVLAAGITSVQPPEERAIGATLTSNATPFSILKGRNYILFAPVFAAFGLVLLIACANIANVLLARAAARQREMAIRLALGAGRARIIRQLLIESLLLAVPAAVAAFGVARAATRMALELYFATVPRLLGGLLRVLPLDPDARVFGFLVAAAFVTTLAFGLAPALEAARASVNFRRSRLRSALVVSQVAVCVLLLIVSGILLRGSRRLEHYDPGFETNNVLELRLQNPGNARAIEKLALEPWVQSAAVVQNGPMNNEPTLMIAPAEGEALRAAYDFISPEYFDVLRVPIVRGRTFSRDEADAGAPVVIVSEATARQFWPGRDALGGVVRIEAPVADRDAPPFRRAQIVGIAANVATGDVFSGKDGAMFYFPAGSRSAHVRGLMIRLKEDTRETRRALLETMERLAPGSSRIVFSFDEMLAVELFPFELSMAVASFLGGLALALAISGVYGVLSYLVAQRTREIGIRMALGATSADVVRLVLRQSAAFAIWGIGIGGAMALGVSKIFASLLEQINTYEPAAYVVAICAVFTTAMAAASVPSMRAARVDPASTLRQE